MIAEGLTGTWFGTEGLWEVAATLRGSRPGDLYGDLVFNFIAEETFRGAVDRLRSEGLVRQFGWDGT
eukprot:935822-Lingulodinium_polyedra.AAC.1